MVSPTNRDYLIRTMIGEAAGQPRQGQAAVAHTIMNRRNAGRWGDSIQDVVTAPNQFEPWQTRADELWNISPESDVYQQTGQIADQVISGDTPDPTQGGLFFLNPDIVRERRGGSLPDWAQNQTASIGGHTFYRGPGNEGNDMANGNRRRPSVYQPQREAGTGNLSQRGGGANTAPLPTAPAPSQDGQGLDLPGRPSKSDMAMAQALMQGAQRDAQNTRGTGLGLAGALAQQAAGAYMSGQYEDEQQQYNQALGEAFSGAQSRGDLMDTMLQSGDEGLRNTALKARLSQPKDGRTSDIKNYEYYRRQTAQSGEKPMSFPEWRQQGGTGPDPVKLGKGDRLVDPRTGQEVAGSAEPAVDPEKRSKAVSSLQSLERQHGIVEQDIDKALESLETGTTDLNVIPESGLAGGIAGLVPGTEAWDVGSLIETIKANVGFDKLQQMREESPTGGALGQVSEREIDYLQSVLGNLSRWQSNEQVVSNLKRIKEIMREGRQARRRAFQRDFGEAPPDQRGNADGGNDTDLPTPTSPEEASQLPSGTRFRTPDGRIKVRP